MYTDWIKKGIDKHYLEILENGTIINYVFRNKKFKFTDPEEIVRAALFVELIEKYKYEQEYINFEVVVPRRTPSDLADIVIFKDPENKEPYIVIECKKNGISEAEFNQAIEQCFGNCNSISGHFALIVSGNTRRAFEVKGYKPLERTDNIIADIPVHYGKVQEWRFKKDDPDWDLQEIGKHDLIQILEKCHDTLWQGGKLAPTVAFDELCKIIFVKVRDEKKARKPGEPYQFQIKTYEKPESVKKRIDLIYKEAMDKDPEVFSEEIKVGPKRLFSVVNHLQSINLNATDLDVKGIAFERFMEDFFKGKIGQYFTPREVVSFMVDMIKPGHEDAVLDPASGSGGFLLHALDYVRNTANEYYKKDSKEHFDYWHTFAKEYLYGIEINDSISRVAKMNMILHDDGHTNVIGADSLKDFNLLQEQNPGFAKEKFDIILTNPPFGANVKEDESPYLKQYILGKEKKIQKTEILFIERCFDFLKWGTGILGIVLPNGILSNTTLSYVRDFILERFKINAIVCLPATAFTHYGAGVESSLLFLEKYTKEEFNAFQAKKLSIKMSNEEALNKLLTIAKEESNQKIKNGSPSQIQVTEEFAPRFNAIIETIEQCYYSLGKTLTKKINTIKDRFIRAEYKIDTTKILDKTKRTDINNKLNDLLKELSILESEYKTDFDEALSNEWLENEKNEYKDQIELLKQQFQDKTDEELKKWIEEHSDYPIFFAHPDKIGYDATGRKCENHLDQVLEAYEEFSEALNSNQLDKLSIGDYGEYKADNNIFILWRSQLEDRMDTYYYQPEFRKLEAFLYKNYKIKRLSEIGLVFDGPFGSNLKNDEYVSDGIPLFRVQNIKDGKVYFEKGNTVYITEDKHEDLKRSEVNPGDVVITKTGWLGNAAVIPNEIKKANIRADLAGVKLYPDAEVTAEYLATFVDSSIGKKLCSRLTSGSTRDRMVISNLKKLPIPIIDDTIQEQIVIEVEKNRKEVERLRIEAEKIADYTKSKTEEIIRSLAME